jgi:apolipoprotein D and lipocalin family protein
MKAVTQMRRLSCLLVISGLCCIASAARAAENAPLPTVHSVDLARYVGSWYEIALLPNRFERQCVSDTQAHYTAQDGGIRVLNRCRKADGRVDSAEGRAKIVAASGNAKLRVTFFWPFYGDYWILALDDDYSEVLVGTPDRRYGWILARRPDLPEARAQALLVRARALGFDVAAFRRVPQIQPLDGAS